MNWKQYVLPFTIGVGVGVAVNRNWPAIEKIARPLLRGALKSGTNLFEKGREVYHAKSEKFSDLIAEIREEEEAKAKAPLQPEQQPAA